MINISHIIWFERTFYEKEVFMRNKPAETKIKDAIKNIKLYIATLKLSECSSAYHDRCILYVQLHQQKLPCYITD